MKISDLLFDSKKRSFERLCSANGLNLSFDQNREHLALMKQIFEEREYADFFPFYKKATILDIGAHCGFFSLFAAKNLQPNSRIISIEPSLKNFSQLKINAATSGCENIESLNVAISSSNGEMSLYEGSSINHSLISNYALNAENTNSVLVKTLSLETLFEKLSLTHIDFLKIDCEGAEYAIFDASSVALFDNVTTLSMEFHDLKSEHFNGNFLAKKLVSFGFSIVKFQYERSTLGLNYGKIIGTKLLK
jgi:FkbM family methyltransferase